MSSNGQDSLREGHQWLIEKCLNYLSNSEVLNTNERKNMKKEIPVEQNKSFSNDKQTDLINLIDDFPTSLHINNNVDTFKDMQMKELLDFVKTSGNCNDTKYVLTQEEEKQYEMFFDKWEAGHSKLDQISNKNAPVGETQENVYSSFYNMNEHYIGTPKVLTPKINYIVHEDNDKINEDLIDEVMLEKNIEKQNLRNTNKLSYSEDKNLTSKKSDSQNGSPQESLYTDKTDIMDEIIRSNTINFIAVDSKHNDEINTINNNNITYITNNKPNQYPYVNTDDLFTKHNIKYLESTVIDEKLKKLCAFKTESEKLHLTPGPTLREKSIVLPQIMKRLSDKKRELEEQSDFSNKLVLDAGSSNQKSKENKNQNYQQSPNRMNLTADAINIHSSKINQTTCKTADTNEGIRFVPVEKLRVLRNEKLGSMSTPEYVKVGPHVLKSPQPLVKDCNKDRFVSYATSHLFNEFVRKS